MTAEPNLLVFLFQRLAQPAVEAQAAASDQRDPGDEQPEATATAAPAPVAEPARPLLPTTQALLAKLRASHVVSGPPDERPDDDGYHGYGLHDPPDILVWRAGALRLVVTVDPALHEISVELEGGPDQAFYSRGARWTRLHDVPGTLDSIVATVKRMLAATDAELAVTVDGLVALCPRLRVGHAR